jgi:hypothetical protein
MKKNIYIVFFCASFLSCQSDKNLEQVLKEKDISNDVKPDEILLDEELYHKEFYEFFKNSTSEKLLGDSILHIGNNDTAHISIIPRTLSLKKKYSFVNDKGTLVNVVRTNFTTLNIEVKTADTVYKFDAFLSPHFTLGAEVVEIENGISILGNEYFAKDSLIDVFSIVVAKDFKVIYLFIKDEKNPFSNPFKEIKN